jgi:RNA polymerase subunit RPABC4/transcription elongation factor Spt4
MQTCSQCNALSPDSAALCVNCSAELKELSSTAVARKEFADNERVKLVRVLVADDSCPACQSVEGTYEKDAVPVLPIEGCSHKTGCRCFYQPYLTTIFP